MTLAINQSAERNKVHIIPILEEYSSPGDQVLEVASGTGQHGTFFCKRNADVFWQPTEISQVGLSNIEGHRLELGQDNFLPPKILDITQGSLPDSKPVQLMVNVNMIHISPWVCTQSLMKVAGELLADGGHLIMYGPYFERGFEPAQGNVDFDFWLKERNSEFGVRYLEDVVAEAESCGLRFVEKREMPANNLIVVFCR